MTLQSTLLEDLPEVYVLSERCFDQPHEVEMMDYREGQPKSQDCGRVIHDITFQVRF